MHHLPPLKSLTFFLVAAKHLSFKRASEELFVTQAAVSQQIKSLEAYFEKPLFIRVGVKTELTEYGQKLFPYVESAMEQIKLGVSAVNTAKTKNSIVVTGTHSFTSLFLGPRIDSYLAKENAVGVQFAPSNHLLSFSGDGIDLAIRRGGGSYSGLESKLLFKDKVVLIASPLLLKTSLGNVDNYTINDLLNLPLLEDTSGDITEAIEFIYKKNKMKRPVGILQTTDAVPVIQSAIAGKGIAFASYCLVAELIRDGVLVNPHGIEFLSDVNIYLVAPKPHFDRKEVKTFCHWLTNEVAQIV